MKISYHELLDEKSIRILVKSLYNRVEELEKENKDLKEIVCHLNLKKKKIEKGEEMLSDYI